MAGSAKKILFLSRALERGGAERQLVLLAKGLAANGWDVGVATFYPGEFDQEIIQSGITMHSLEKKSRWHLFLFLKNWFGLVRKEAPLIIHSYLTVCNILAALVKLISPRTKVVWGIRASIVDLSRYDWVARLTGQVERWVAGLADLIIVNSQAGREHLIVCGYPQDKIIVIYNGIDTSRFFPDVALGRNVRQEWGIQDDEILVGLIARVDPLKDHPTFLQAALSAAEQNEKLRFVCVGGGEPEYVEQLKNIPPAQILGARLLWSGARDDMMAVYNALDVSVSASITEGFSNSIGEAMACGVPCIVTNVGDSAQIVATTGIIVPSQNPEQLAAAILAAPTKNLSEKNMRRQRIADNFSKETLFLKTEKALHHLL